jgi:NAD(P)-dependent dehydrogenase (short-subunit alcohol dehydrogenase family)
MSFANRLQGRRIIVFGSAAGIGAATVKRLAQEGARVCAADINLAGHRRSTSRHPERR